MRSKKTSVWQELKELRRLKRVPTEEKEIMIYTEHDGYYLTFEGIINELLQQGKKFCYITSDPSDPILTKNNPSIHTFYLKKLLPPFMIFKNPKVFVMTLTDLNKFHLKRSSNPVHYVYLFHALVSTHMMYHYGAFDYYDSILCVGPHQIQEIHKYEQQNNSLKQKKLVAAGYYRLEKLYQEYKKYTREQKENREGKEHGKTILIASSWGKENVIEAKGEVLIQLLLDRGYNVIVRPHPETVKRSPEIITLLHQKFSNNPTFRLETSVRTDESLMRADLLISDCSGIMIEYAFGTERPFISIDVPPKVKNPRYKELEVEPMELALRKEIGVLVSPEDIDKVPEIIEDLIARKEEYKEKIINARNEYVFNFGKSSEIGAKYILDIVNEKDRMI